MNKVKKQKKQVKTEEWSYTHGGDDTLKIFLSTLLKRKERSISYFQAFRVRVGLYGGPVNYII